MDKYPNHTPLVGGGCLDLVKCECHLAFELHCASCGRAVITEVGRVPGNFHTFHVGTRERLWALEGARRKAAGK